MAAHIPLMVEVHAEEVAIHWLRRDLAVDAPHYDRKFLSRLDERIEANLDGLRVAAAAGLETAQAAFDANQEPGEAFALAVCAFETGDEAAIAQVVDAVAIDGTGALRRAVASAAGWLGSEQMGAHIPPLLEDMRATVRALGLAIASVQRGAIEVPLETLLQDPVPMVRAQAAKLAGVTGRSDLVPLIRPSKDFAPEVAFELIRAAVLLGERGRPLDALRSLAVGPGARTRTALELAVLASPMDATQNWLAGLGPEGAETVALAIGLMGLPAQVPWLIEAMRDPKLARRAGESLSLITGVDLAALDLEGSAPEDFDEGPNDDPEDEMVALDPDEDLPWPEPDLVAEWWAGESGRYAADGRYFLGQPVSEAGLGEAFAKGTQRHRRIAALAQVLAKPGSVLPNWRAREALVLG
ncbi:uncharacterized protein (TIGR02270 family) [Rhodobacter aestuarii]|uniref:TIGR02270 family protein n=1 Tax=Rhodobacter aestuarii TaxID=453582 RepID=A0A1N7PL66_9RHOB|nr:TIGR02270 family protein [Rhodobacter aestuarii]PTV94329.1 uncharacterized protein (TIGR02270 family) [Rhodobacter aestuarii]SIT11331.1 conserved hypothetical protein [Rhodobacter aestuarii]